MSHDFDPREFLSAEELEAAMQEELRYVQRAEDSKLQEQKLLSQMEAGENDDEDHEHYAEENNGNGGDNESEHSDEQEIIPQPAQPRESPPRQPQPAPENINPFVQILASSSEFQPFSNNVNIRRLVQNSDGDMINLLQSIMRGNLSRINQNPEAIDAKRPISPRSAYLAELAKSKFMSSLEDKPVTYNLNVSNLQLGVRKFNDDMQTGSLAIDDNSKQTDIANWFRRTTDKQKDKKIKLLELDHGSVLDEDTYIKVIFDKTFELVKNYIAQEAIVFGDFAYYMLYCAKEGVNWDSTTSLITFKKLFGWVPGNLDIYYFKSIRRPNGWESDLIETRDDPYNDIFQARKILCKSFSEIFGNINIIVNLYEGGKQRLPVSLICYDINAIYYTNTGWHSAFAKQSPNTAQGFIEDIEHVHDIVKKTNLKNIHIVQHVKKGPDFSYERQHLMNITKNLFNCGFNIVGLDELAPVKDFGVCSLCNSFSLKIFCCHRCSKSGENVMCSACFFKHCNSSADEFTFWKCPFCRHERPILPSNNAIKNIYPKIDFKSLGIVIGK